MIKKIIIMIAVVLWYGTVFAAHPLITDDTGTQDAGKFQVEINSEFTNDKETEDSVTLKSVGGEIAVILSYGVTDNTDFVIGTPFQWSREEEDGDVTSDVDGVSDMSLELKWRFFEKEGLSFALKPGVTLPTGDEEKGLGSGRVSYGLVAIATKDIEPVALHFNLGYTRNEYKLEEDDEMNINDIWHVSLAGELKIFEKLRAVVNIGTERNSDRESNTNPAFVLGGLIYSVLENFDIDLGVKGGLNGPETDCSILAGMTGRF